MPLAEAEKLGIRNEVSEVDDFQRLLCNFELPTPDQQSHPGSCRLFLTESRGSKSDVLHSHPQFCRLINFQKFAHSAHEEMLKVKQIKINKE